MATGSRVTLSALLLCACDSELRTADTGLMPGDHVALDDRPVQRSAEPVPPVTGGTLLVTHDGAFAVVSDPARDLIDVVDLDTDRARSISLEPGSRPFRAAEDADGRVHVTLRGMGTVVTVDPETSTAVRVSGACPNPRGIAFDPDANAVLVACAGGDLVRLDADTGAVEQRDHVAPDLRDVLVQNGTTLVTRFRAAELLAVSREGEVSAVGGPISPTLGGVLLRPTTAWRTLSRPDGGWFMLHQLASTEPFDVESDESTTYGSGLDPCNGAARPALSATDPDGTIVSSGVLPFMALAVDVALSPDGRQAVVASPSQADEPGFSGPFVPIGVGVIDLDVLSPSTDLQCTAPVELPVVEDFVAVAFTPDGELLAQTQREPRLYRFVGGEVADLIPLEGRPMRDTGHDLFHLATESGLACATCHPEGGDDGHVWGFLQQGPRRTQPLHVGLRGTEPFHWGGDMPDMDALVHEVRDERMGGAILVEARVEALQEWLFALEAPNPIRSSTGEWVTRGASVFAAAGCASCHAGERFTSNGFADLGQGPLQIPSLRGVALRPPYMHDGRAPDLLAATKAMPGTAELGDADIDALVAYLESL